MPYSTPKFDYHFFDTPCICSVCNRLLYRKSVKLLEKNKYSSVSKSLFTDIASFDTKEYICTTCHSKGFKGKIPCQAVYNDMSVDEISAELTLLEKLEQILIARRIVFKKIVVMHRKKYQEQFVIYQLIVIRHARYYHVYLKGLV